MTIAIEKPTADEVDQPTAESEPSGEPDAPATTRSRAHALKSIRWGSVLAYGVLPAVALLVTLVLGYLKWQDTTAHQSAAAQAQSVAAATDGTIALLSYRHDTAEHELTAAQDRLTGSFRDAYTALIHDLVIPGATQKHISTVATVPAAASVSADESHAVVMVFINQTTTVGTEPPTATASAVRVTLDKIGDRWLISDFTPV